MIPKQSVKRIKNQKRETTKKNHLQCRRFCSEFKVIPRNDFTPTNYKKKQKKYKKFSSENAKDHLSIIV